MLTLAGWAVALVGASLALIVWRELSMRMEAVARACHELRGPITAARLGLQLGARTGQLSSERLRALDLELGRASLALQDLTGLGVEAASRAAGLREPVDVPALLADSVEAWKATAQAAGASIEVTWSGAPAAVLGDRFRLAQATGNLIANALEHGGSTVLVCGRLSRGRVRIEVIDDGPGLSALVDHLARRARHRAGRRGRGLAIATEIVRAHGGRLSGAPSGRGARLVIDLPSVTRENEAGEPAG